jgi:RNA polymerase sigma factor (sigma-70 family)
LTLTALDAELCEALALRATTGDQRACRELVEHLWPAWVSMVRTNRSMAGLARSEDHVHDVVTRLVEKIGRPDGRGLLLYPPWRERNPDKNFLDWIRIVTKNAIRDYVREQLGSTRTRPGEISVKRLLNEFASSPALDELGIRPPFTAAQTARELVEFARGRLSEAQLRALGLWLEGADFEEMAEELALTAEEARKLMRSAVATLRRHFDRPPEPVQ